MKLTPAMREAIATVKMWESYGVYMPFANRARSFEACERRDLLVYRSVDQGSRRNGYALTEAGRALLSLEADRG